MPDTARERLRQAMVQEAKDGLARYYHEFPERIGDERATDALAWSLRGVQRMVRLLDQYDIRDKPPEKVEKAG